MRNLTAYLSGLVFGAGIAISGMGNPAKVLNFFDFAGTWDPSLALVMASALAVTALGYRLVLRGKSPAYEPAFTLPTSRVIDAKLLGGAAIFGVGWGLSGFCPGGSIPMMGTFDAPVYVFTTTMVLGIFTARSLQHLAALRATHMTKA